MDPELDKSWEQLLNRDVMRSRLISASIYIAGFELLKDSIIGRIRDFFCTGFDDNGEIVDPKYQSDVLGRNRSPLYASVDWLKEVGAIDDAEITALDRVKTCRNHLAHRILRFLDTEGMPPDFEKCFHEMVALLHKIELWWIKNVEIPTNPDFDGKEIAEDEILPGRILGLQLLCDIAVGPQERSQAYYDEIRKRKDQERPQPGDQR